MKHMLWLVLAGMLVGISNTWAADDDWKDEYRTAGTTVGKNIEIKLRGDYLKPKDDLYWDKAMGGSLQGIVWIQPNFGFGFEIGIQKWESTEEDWIYRVIDDTPFYAHEEGDANMIPIGVSGLYQIQVGNTAKILLEGGARYVAINSKVERRQEAPYAETATHIYYRNETIEIDFEDGMVGFIGANIEFDLGSGWSLFVGGGYQFDIAKGDYKVGGKAIDEHSLAGAFARAGVGLSF